jgi:hypothetical protein
MSQKNSPVSPVVARAKDKPQMAGEAVVQRGRGKAALLNADVILTGAELAPLNTVLTPTELVVSIMDPGQAQPRKIRVQLQAL